MCTQDLGPSGTQFSIATFDDLIELEDVEDSVLIFFPPGMMRNSFFFRFAEVLEIAAGRWVWAMWFRTEDAGVISLALINV